MQNELLLLAGSDIPFPEARITIHQPTLKEIGYIGENAFFIGCGFLDFSKNLLNQSDKIRLADYDDFDILMSIMINKDGSTKKSVDCAMLVLSLLFPLHEIAVEVRNNKPVIMLKNETEECELNKNNFPIFKKIIIKMFDLNFGKNETEKYNPSGTMAEKIAEKFKKRQEQLKKLAGEKNNNEKNISILNRYVSILAVGLQKDLNELMQYTVYQLFNEFQRFQLKVQWDAYVQARMAGAKDLDEVDNWMIDLKDQKINKNKK